MHTRTARRRPVTIVAVALVAMLAIATTAFAVLTGSGGTGQLRMDNRGETGPVPPTSSVPWVDLPGADIVVTIPSTGTRLLNARFTAESTCLGAVGLWCTTRIIAVNAAGFPTELDPASGTDFHFDSASPGVAGRVDSEAHAMERSKRLQGGTYKLKVQYAVSNAAVLFTLDDWHFTIETTV